jgi:hypothetical protein
VFFVGNDGFERSLGRVFGEPRSEAMIGIKQLRSLSTQFRVAQLVITDEKHPT